MFWLKTRTRTRMRTGEGCYHQHCGSACGERHRTGVRRGRRHGTAPSSGLCRILALVAISSTGMGTVSGNMDNLFLASAFAA